MTRFVRSIALAAALALALLPGFQAEAQTAPNYLANPASYNPIASTPAFVATTTSQATALVTTNAQGVAANELLVCAYQNGTVGNQPYYGTANNTIYLDLGTTAVTATVAGGTPINQGCTFVALGANTYASVITATGTSVVTFQTVYASSALAALLPSPEVVQTPSPCLVASASTVDLGAACTNGSVVNVTGTTTITSFGSTAPVGSYYFIYTVAAAGITYNSTSMILHGGSSLTGGAGNFLVCYVRTVQGNWTCSNTIN